MVANANTSGQGSDAQVPEEIKGWNWGAFGLSWIWGIGNSTYIALLALIPFVNIIMIIVLGINGNKWAWQNRHWGSIEDFKRTQRIWRNVWLWILIGSLVLWILIIVLVAVYGSNADTHAG